MRFASLFAGIGGFDLGLENAGMTCVTQIEIDPYPHSVLERHWPDVPKLYDIKETSIPNGRVDVICGGFPCQDISIAGQRRGLAGERSGLWHEYARIVDETRPEWVVIENVAGLLSSNNGDDMASILGALERLGYVWAYRLVDSQWFGVAQRRRRVFIVGHLAACGGRAGQILFECEGVRRDSPPSRQTRTAVAALTATGVGTCGADDNQTQAGHLMPVVSFNFRQDPIHNTEIMHSLSTALDSGVLVPEVAHTLTAKAPVAVHENSRAELNTSDIAYALTASQGGKPGQSFPAVLAPAGESWRVRKLTPVECERLQGFPDGWADNLSDSRRYKALGNAVTVNVAEWIGRRITGTNHHG